MAIGRKGVFMQNNGGGGADVTIEVNSTTFGTEPAGGTFNVPIVDQDGGEVGEIDGAEVLVYRYPYRDQWRSGAVTSYCTGDDGDLQEGAGASFTTLEANRLNVFATTDRFTDELGGTTYAKDIVIDHSTFDVLSGTHGGARAYYRIPYTTVRMEISGGTTSAITACQGTSITGFTSGWEMANIPQLNSLVDNEEVGTGDGLNYTPFNISIAATVANRIWANNFNFDGSLAAYLTANSVIGLVSGANNSRAIATRWVYWNPATQEFQATAP